MQNPFILGIAEGEHFCNRENEQEDLLRFARNAQKVVFYSKRRYGKSSLVAQVLNKLSSEGFLTVYADLFAITSDKDFVTKFSSAVFNGIGKGADPRTLSEKIKNVFSRLIPTIEVFPDRLELTVKFDRDTKLEFLLDDLMDGIHNYVEEKGFKTCIVLDEFQEISEIPTVKKIEGTLRSHIQRHPHISYFFVGSRRRILLDMFTSRSRPFYKSSFIYTLQEIPKTDFVVYIKDKFKNTGKVCTDESAQKIYDLCHGYTYYVQKLSSLCWDITKDICDDDIVGLSYKLLLKLEKNDFEGIWSGLTLNQRALLKSLAQEPTDSIFAKTYLDIHGFSIGGLQKSLSHLLERDLVEKENDVYKLTDPIMAAWLVNSQWESLYIKGV